MAQRIMMKRMPSSMSEKAHSSIAPKATGVKKIIKMSRSVIAKSIMVIGD
jgi:hypothetical protein